MFPVGSRCKTVPSPSLQEWADGAFTIKEFLVANAPRFQGGIYLGGKLNYDDAGYAELFEFTPFGLTQKVRARADGAVPLHAWAATTAAAWRATLHALETVRPADGYARGEGAPPPAAGGDGGGGGALTTLPPLAKYGRGTWEWTIGREFFDHIADRGAFLLERAISVTEGKSDAEARSEDGQFIALLLEAR